MIRFALKCSEGHAFDSWFASGAAFDKLLGAGMVACPDCGSVEVEKSLMAPRVRPGRQTGPAPSAEPDKPLTETSTAIEAKLKELKQHVEANSDYVGLRFAAEARKMHDGEIPHRSIYGEARPDDAKKLIEDGVPVAPLPFRPTRKTS